MSHDWMSAIRVGTMMADHSIVDGHLFLLSPLTTVLDESSANLDSFFFDWLDESPDISFDAYPAACKQYCTCNAFFGGSFFFLLLRSLVLRFGKRDFEEFSAATMVIIVTRTLG